MPTSPKNAQRNKAQTGAKGGADEQELVLPWWRNPINIGILVVAFTFIVASIGYSLGSASASQPHNAVDTGFLQDMRIHHEQAVSMAIIYLEAAPDGDANIRSLAHEIAVDQSTENGRMVQMLRLFKESETNESDQVMGWMNEPTPLEQMPGLASDAEMTQLQQTRGHAEDVLFAKLMIAHHKGGIHMAQYAADHGKNSEVVAIAKADVTGQNQEVVELTKWAGL
jgi:uncharacterized protein (DUF305 family)